MESLELVLKESMLLVALRDFHGFSSGPLLQKLLSGEIKALTIPTLTSGNRSGVSRAL